MVSFHTKPQLKSSHCEDSTIPLTFNFQHFFEITHSHPQLHFLFKANFVTEKINRSEFCFILYMLHGLNKSEFRHAYDEDLITMDTNLSLWGGFNFVGLIHEHLYTFCNTYLHFKHWKWCIIVMLINFK